MDILDEKSVSLPEVAAILKDKEKAYQEGGIELLYQQKKSLEHASKFAKIGDKDAVELAQKLSKLDLTLSSERIMKIVDLMPKTVDDIRAIFAKERFKYTEEEIKKVTDIVDEYR
jgi:DNA-directed RNA polymerase subunit F